MDGTGDEGGRFITHNLKLARAEGPLANFYASGVLALGRKTGPFLWQLPPGLRFDAERLSSFIDLLPRSAAEAERLAERHDGRLQRGALTRAAADVRYRHAFEVRHPSWIASACFDLLRARRVGFVVSDTPQRFPCAFEVTADFVYVRLHGSQELYASGYTEEALQGWADRVEAWARSGLDAYVYFDNDARAFAPKDAMRLIEICAERRKRTGIEPAQDSRAAPLRF